MSEIAGLPAHPLLVHAAVVLLPLAALFSLVACVRPAVRRRLGVLVPGCAVVAAVSVWMARQAGVAYAGSATGLSDSWQEHADFGSNAMLLAGVYALVAIVHHFLMSGGRARQLSLVARVQESRVLRVVLALAEVLLALASVAYVVQAGHTGATLVWG